MNRRLFIISTTGAIIGLTALPDLGLSLPSLNKTDGINLDDIVVLDYGVLDNDESYAILRNVGNQSYFISVSMSIFNADGRQIRDTQSTDVTLDSGDSYQAEIYYPLEVPIETGIEARIISAEISETEMLGPDTDVTVHHVETGPLSNAETNPYSNG